MRKLCLILSLVTGAGCSDESAEPRSVTINTPNGQVVATSTQIDEAPQTITLVTGEALAKLQSQAAKAPAFATAYLSSNTQLELKDYDRAFRNWQASSAKQHTNEEVVSILGACLGEKCVAGLDMEWVTVSDHYGTDYAVRSRMTEVIGFPFASVEKRIKKNEFDFMHGIYYTLKHTIESGDSMQRGK
ncbi:MAG: DUF3806 domain-containing protein [Phycisphaeraceae bacterium]